MPKSLLLGLAALSIGIMTSGFATEAREQSIVCACGLFHVDLVMANADGSDAHAFLWGTGSNYNASFSPDGQWVTFTAERQDKAEIYRAHPDGSALEQLTRSSSYDDQGALSPDGKALAFVSTRGGGWANIWLQDLSSRRARPLTRGRHGHFRPNWSPGGRWIAFSSDQDTDPGRATPKWELLQLTAIYIVHPDGSGLRRITPLTEFSGSPKWSQNGKQIVFYQVPNIRFMHGQQPVLAAVPQIVSVDIETGQTKVRTSGYQVKLSPQYLSGGDIGYTSVLEHQIAVQYTSARRGFTVPRKDSLGIEPSWSPDGSKIVYQTLTFPHPRWMKPAGSTDPRFHLVQSRNTFSFPALSPDGKHVVVPGGTALTIMDVDGSNARTLFDSKSTDKQILSSSWSIDGKYVAFDIGRYDRDRTYPAQIALIRPDGSDFRLLTGGLNNSAFPSFSPDSQRLVYRVQGTEQGLRVMDLRTHKIAKLTTDWDNFPAWSPRNDEIIFTSLRTGDFELSVSVQTVPAYDN